MGDLADEIEQMQAEINAFDDKLDALDANGEEGRKEEEPVKKSIFSRLGSSGDVAKAVRKSSIGEDKEQSEGEEEETIQSKRRKSSVKSAVIDTSRRRESEISKEDINKAQLGGEAGKRRASRMFKNLLGTLRTFDEKTKSESVSSKRAEIDRKVEERVAADRRKIIEEKRLLLIKKREKEKLLELLQDKKEFAELRIGWEEHALEQSKYIRTTAEPHIYWKPRIMEAEAKELNKKTKEKVMELLEESKVEWDSQRAEMTTEIKAIKDRHQFKDIELRVDSDTKRDIPMRPAMAHRLVITKTVKNDQRIVQPKSSNGRIEPIQPTTPEENGKGSKEERKQKEKEGKRERRKEIEKARKRRHKSDSESEDEYEERPRKLVLKEPEIPKITKDVRRVAPKDDPPKPETNILPSSTRRISLKTTKKTEIEQVEEEPKRRRIEKKSESHNTTSSDKKQSSDSSSSSSSSTESDSCNRTPSKSG